jgi:hypothetical protein
MLRVSLPCVILHPATPSALAVTCRATGSSSYRASLQQQSPPPLRRGGTRSSLGCRPRLRFQLLGCSQALQLWRMRFVRPNERNLCHLDGPRSRRGVYPHGAARWPGTGGVRSGRIRTKGAFGPRPWPGAAEEGMVSRLAGWLATRGRVTGGPRRAHVAGSPPTGTSLMRAS